MSMESKRRSVKFKEEAEQSRADSCEKIGIINDVIKNSNFKLQKSDGFEKKTTTFRITPNSKNPVQKLK